jgi:tetratricopeptide (TPR) repeat protein
MLLAFLLACDLGHPIGASCHKLAGIELAKVGNYRDAEPHFAKACAEDARELDACYFHARALYALDRFAESLRVLEKRANTSSEWKRETAIGQALDALNEAKAEEHLRRALKLREGDKAAPSELDPLLALGAFLYREGRAGEALQLLEQSAKGYERLAGFQYQLGRALLRAERTAEAIAALKAAVASRPNYAEAHGLLSRAYHAIGKPNEGAQHANLAKQ